MNKAGLLDIKKAYFGDKLLSPNNAFVGEIPLIVDPEYKGLKIKVLGTDATISVTHKGGNAPDLYFSTNNGKNWQQMTDITYIHVYNGNYVCFKGNNANGFSFSSTKYTSFNVTGTFGVYGNIMSLIDDGECEETIIPNNYCFYRLFSECSDISSANGFILPATTLKNYCYGRMFYNSGLSYASGMILSATTLLKGCYSYMFEGCTGLTTAPVLPATTLANECYREMFSDCSSLSLAPVLPATTMAYGCYWCMFEYCTSLTTAPVLPAMTMADYCYCLMFRGCTNLTTAPVLPATTLTSYCYSAMFDDCIRLNYIKCLATTISSDYTWNWVRNVASDGTFVKDANTTWPTGYDGVPTYWTIQNA